MIAETTLELLRDPNHWGFEVISTVVQDVVLLGFAVPVIKRAVRNHDLKKHQNDCHHE